MSNSSDSRGSVRSIAPGPESSRLETANILPGSVHVLFGAHKTRIVLEGEIDADLGPELIDAAGEADKAQLPIDVETSNVTFMDSSGVAFLARLAARSSQPVTVVSPPEVVEFLLNLTKIGDMLEITHEDPGVDATLPSN